ncbi:MAG: hypothetical protein M5R36_13725 [Deltaproteobacteria bacterium]|nr:hypothetical protein [Deltaproteobacteria bacterium]
MTRRNFLIAVTLAVIAVRVLFLCFSEFVYDEEEYKTGSIAALVMDGPPLPLLEYQPGDYEGGTFFFGLLTIPFFAALGRTFVGLKAVSLATTLLLVLCQTAWAEKARGTARGRLHGASRAGADSLPHADHRPALGQLRRNRGAHRAHAFSLS